MSFKLSIKDINFIRGLFSFLNIFSDRAVVQLQQEYLPQTYLVQVLQVHVTAAEYIFDRVYNNRRKHDACLWNICVYVMNHIKMSFVVFAEP
jgi:hypothetical protein